MNLDVIRLRRPKIDYVSPPVCEGSFSGSGSVTIVLEPFTRNRITGVVISDDGNGNLIVSWPDFPGAVCYNVYDQQPDGSLVLIAECVECCEFPIPPDLDDPTIVITPIDDDGEGDPSDPVRPPDGPPGPETCDEFIDTLDLSISNDSFEMAKNLGLVAGTFDNLCGMYFDRIDGPVRTSRASSPIQGSQSASDLVNATSDFFLPEDQGKFLQFSSGGDAREILMVISPTQVQVDVVDTVVLSTFTVYGSTIGGQQGNMSIAGDGGHLAGFEALPDGSTLAMVWYNHNTGEMRTVGVGFDFLPIQLNADGFLMYTFNNGSTIETFVYNPNTQLSTNCGVFTGADMNDSLLVVGTRVVDHSAEPNPNESRATKWQSGVMSDIPAPADAVSIADGRQVDAMFVNNSGLIMGTYLQDLGGGIQQSRTFYNNGAGSFSIGHFFVGADPSQGEVFPDDLSDSGIACGSASIDTTEHFRGWRWSIAGGLQMLNPLPGNDSCGAEGVNDEGYVVGLSQNTGDPSSGVAVIWFPGEATPQRIIDLLPEGHGWTSLIQADLISNNLEITGSGMKDAEFKFYFCKLCLDE